MNVENLFPRWRLALHHNSEGSTPSGKNGRPVNIQTTPYEFQPIDLEKWARREHFQFFSTFSEPFFSICAEVKCGGLVARSKQQGRSATFGFWHGVLRAANAVEEFRTRIVDGRPVVFERTHLSPTVLRPDKTFGIGFVPFLDDYEMFATQAAKSVEEVRASTGFQLSEESRRVDLIHFSTVPWFRFMGLTHARPLRQGESEPKITLGKFGPGPDGKLLIPVSITAHHGMVDGYHVALFLEELEKLWA